MDGIRYWIETEGTGHWFLLAFPVVLVCLLIWFKGRRLRFLIPSFLISLVIINPWFFQKWEELGLYAYWRILWVLPVIPVVASLVPSITERIQKSWIKAVVAAAGVGMVVVGGTFLYNGAGGSFVEAANASKEPVYVVQIANKLLELDDKPRVIAQDPIGVYLRQYTGEIDQLFGRNIHGHISGVSSEARTVNTIINDLEGDLAYIASFMANEDYGFLVINDEGRQDKLNDAGFKLLDTVVGYGIYESTIVPSLSVERDELGKVISLSTIDETGALINGEKGYATISYAYDDYGNTIRIFHKDVEGNGFSDRSGVAGFEYEYDEWAHVLMEKTIGPCGEAVSNTVGYAEIRRRYNGNNIVEEAYYDAAGSLTDRIDTKYAMVRMEYDDLNNLTQAKFYNSTGEAVISSAGYALVKYTYDNNRMISESYYDTKGNPILIALNYSSRFYTYDEYGNISSEAYFDMLGAPTNCINGYSRIDRKYDENKNIISQRFLNKEGFLVVTGYGYAEVHKEYDGYNLIREEYYDTEKKPLIKSAGYAGIEQVWNGDTLYSRTYLDKDGFPTNRVDGYSRVVWEQSDNCTNVKFYNIDGDVVEIEGLNLTTDLQYGEDGWSNWILPNYNVANSTQIIGYANLGSKADADVYTCSIEVEFKNVTATEGQSFHFWTQGAQDGKWITGNVWDGKLINIDNAPEDGIYKYISKPIINGDMVDISSFNIGFRCDYWGTGMYRVRMIKIEKGNTLGEWSPGL